MCERKKKRDKIVHARAHTHTHTHTHTGLYIQHYNYI